MKKNTKAGLSAVLAMALMLGMVPSSVSDVDAAKKAKIAKKNYTITVGKTQKISIKNKNKKAKYLFKSSNKKIATVSKKGVVKAVKVGSAKITVTEKLKKKKKLGAVKVKVINKTNSSATPGVNTKVTEAPAKVSAVPSTDVVKESATPVTSGTPQTPDVVPSLQPTEGATEVPTAAPTEKVIANATIDPVTSNAFPVYREMEPYPENNPDIEFKMDEGKYESMKQASIVSTGNNARVKKAIEKARSGQDVTLAYIGGSITEGEAARPNNNCYAQYSASLFASAFGTGNNVKFINAGMSGTPSALGVIRYERDVVERNEGKAPDILFIEFAVNDSDETTQCGAMDGLIRKAAKAGSAVVLILSVFKPNNGVRGEEFKQIAAKYDLPVVSMKDATDKFYKEEEFSVWYFNDAWHPTNVGHDLMARIVFNLMDVIDKEAPDTDNLGDVDNIEPYRTKAYADIKMLEPSTVDKLLADPTSGVKSVSVGSFNSTFGESGTYQFNGQREKFPTNWMHDTANGTDSLKFELNCKTILFVHCVSKDKAYGDAEVYLDGKLVKKFTSYDQSGWNQPSTVSILEEDEMKDHTLEIKMAEGNENKKFTVYCLGVG